MRREGDAPALKAEPRTIRLEDYEACAWDAPEIELRFQLYKDETLVESLAYYRRAPGSEGDRPPLRLDGIPAELVEIDIDDTPVEPEEYVTLPQGIEIQPRSDHFSLRIVTRLQPHLNASLQGLYRSGSCFCTQCEAEGFRHITFFQDRPDQLSTFTTRIEADRNECPVLLANGNSVASGDLGDGRHSVTWKDPHPKPCYLFAMVAGDLGMADGSFRTASGRQVAIQVFCERGDEARCGHAIRSLEKAMRWDEEVYGREYDLDLYMIVAVDDFNFGAMENKGLNIFNSALVLARPETATDADYLNIERVVAHEYFHNWSGNRVTLRDWFQLSLKEGFTVFREHSFAADMSSAAVQRIDEVRVLRRLQFPEDAGPMAHAVRPDSYITIDNFYTATVYEKGSELIRMLHTLVGAETFRRASDLYFERHDGQAVTTDALLAAVEEAAGIDLTQFRRWYERPGTPLVEAEIEHDPTAAICTLRLSQSMPPIANEEQSQEPFHIPVAVGLIDAEGRDIPLRLEAEETEAPTTRVLEVDAEENQFRFHGVESRPVPSILRGFSAPVRLEMDCPDEDLVFRLAHDSDGFNRWEAGQSLSLRVLRRLVEAQEAGGALALDPGLSAAFGRLLDHDTEIDAALRAESLMLPLESYVGDQMETVLVDSIHEARTFLRSALACDHRAKFQEHYERASGGDYDIDPESVGRRRLRNICLRYLVATGEESTADIASEQFASADNMTDEISALSCLADRRGPRRDEALASFHKKWSGDGLVMNKWLAVQAGASGPSVLDEVDALQAHEIFDLGNPNKVRALFGVFCRNAVHFHARDGRGYAFIRDRVLELDARNPQLAAGLAGAFSRWRRFDENRQASMRAALESIAGTSGLSPNVYEVVTKSL